MKRLLFVLLFSPLIAYSQGGTAKALRADTLIVNKIATKGGDTLSTIPRVRQIIHDSLSTYPAGVPDSSVFATRYFVGSAYAPLASPTFTGTLTTPGLVISAASPTYGRLVLGIGNAVISQASDTVGLAAALALKANLASPAFTGNPDLSGSSTLKLFTGAGLLKSASDGYVTAVDTFGTLKLDSLKVDGLNVTSNSTLGAATGTSLALGGATLGTNALAVTGTTDLIGNIAAGKTGTNLYGEALAVRDEDTNPYSQMYSMTIFNHATHNVDGGAFLAFGGGYNGTSITAFGGIGSFKANNTPGDYGAYTSIYARTHGSTPAEKMRITDLGLIGLGTATPYHLLSGKTSGTAAFNITNSTYNTVVSSAAQESDTSSFNMNFTGTGKPQFEMKDHLGASKFKVDSVGVGIGGATIGTNALAVTGTVNFGMTAGSIPYTGTGGILRQINGSLFWDSTNARLGIGTTGPLQKLSVIGESYFGSNVNDGLYIQTSAGGVGELIGLNHAGGAYNPIIIRAGASGTGIYLTTGGLIGLGTTTPYHLLSGKTTSTAAFNITNSTYNTVVSSAAQESDTSAANITFSPGGDPELTLKNALGAVTLKADSNGNLTASGEISEGVDTLDNKLEKAAFADSAENHSIGVGTLAAGKAVFAAGVDSIYAPGNLSMTAVDSVGFVYKDAANQITKIYVYDADNNGYLEELPAAVNYASTNGSVYNTFIECASGDYNMTNSVTIVSGRNLHIAGKGTRLYYAYNYTGSFLNIVPKDTAWSGGVTLLKVEGFRITCGNDPGWGKMTGIYVKPLEDAALVYCTFKDLMFTYMGVGIDIQCANTNGWANGNVFDNIVIEYFKSGIRMRDNSSYATPEGNVFSSIRMQAHGDSTLFALDSVDGQYNTFRDCMFWDAPAGAKGIVWGPKGFNNIVTGGFLTILAGITDYSSPAGTNYVYSAAADGVTGRISWNNLNAINLAFYANRAAAKAAGLDVGEFYRTGADSSSVALVDK